MSRVEGAKKKLKGKGLKVRENSYNGGEHDVRSVFARRIGGGKLDKTVPGVKTSRKRGHADAVKKYAFGGGVNRQEARHDLKPRVAKQGFGGPGVNRQQKRVTKGGRSPSFSQKGVGKPAMET